MTSNLEQAAHDQEWEDVPEDEDAQDMQRIDTPSPASSMLSSPRKRKTVTKTTFIAASPRRNYATARPRQVPQRESGPLVTQEQVVDALKHGVRSSTSYTFDVITTSLSWLRKPLAFFLLLWLIATILVFLSATLRAAFSPLCIIPGISHTPLCFHPTTNAEGRPATRHVDFPQMVNIQSKTFEQLLDESAGGSGLALEIKKAEMATKDLITMVKVSQLTSRDLLAKSLNDFVEDAMKTGRGLHKLSSGLGGAVDSIMAVNDYALRSIEAAAEQEQSRNAIVTYIWPKTTMDGVITKSFDQAMSVLSSNLGRLVLQAEASLQNLDKLEQQLQVIHELTTREDVALAGKRDELLADLWTKLGGNRRQMRGYDAHLGLLRDVGTYRTRALAHVVATLETLTSLSTDMEDLRERVAAPELVGDEIPLEVHVRSIKSGIERLSEGRLKAKERSEAVVQRLLGFGSD